MDMRWKYFANFLRFNYVNPAAPKGGEFRLVSNLWVSTFDSLLTGALDETGSSCGLLAQDVVADGLSATFKLGSDTRFHNGDAVMVATVLTSPKHRYTQALLSAT